MLRLFSVVLPQKKLMAPKTDVLWIGAIVCSTVVAILFSYEVAAGPCYRNSESVDSQTMRCSRGSELVPWGSCPSLPSAVSVPCGTLFVSQSIVIGTSGNEQTGFDNQELNEDACWKFYICQPVVTLGASRGPDNTWFWLPRYSCQIVGGGTPSGGWSAMHATGASCTNQK